MSDLRIRIFTSTSMPTMNVSSLDLFCQAEILKNTDRLPHTLHLCLSLGHTSKAQLERCVSWLPSQTLCWNHIVSWPQRWKSATHDVSIHIYLDIDIFVYIHSVSLNDIPERGGLSQGSVSRACFRGLFRGMFRQSRTSQPYLKLSTHKNTNILNIPKILILLQKKLRSKHIRISLWSSVQRWSDLITKKSFRWKVNLHHMTG